MTWPDVRQAARGLPFFRVIFGGNFSGLIGVRANVISTGMYGDISFKYKNYI